MGRFIMNCLVLMALLAKVVTAEVYEESNPGLTQDYDAISITRLNELGTDTYWRENMLLPKLYRLRQLDSTRDRPIQEVETRPDVDAKKPIVKRGLNVFNGLSWPQRKWKTRKGKGNAFCYFKLCAFRMYP